MIFNKRPSSSNYLNQTVEKTIDAEIYTLILIFRIDDLHMGFPPKSNHTCSIKAYFEPTGNSTNSPSTKMKCQIDFDWLESALHRFD